MRQVCLSETQSCPRDGHFVPMTNVSSALQCVLPVYLQPVGRKKLVISQFADVGLVQLLYYKHINVLIGINCEE